MNQPPLSEAEAARFLPTAEDPFPAPRESLDLADADLSFNREVSWVDFNDRVLQLAEDPVAAAAGAGEVRGDLHVEPRRVLHDPRRRPARPGRGRDHREAPRRPQSVETIDALRARIQPQMERQARLVDERLRPGLAEHGIRDHRPATRCPRTSAPALGERFKRQIYPVLTPLAVGLGRPFPYISNLSLSLAVLVRDPQTDQTIFARVKVPKEMLPRFVPVVEGSSTFVLLEDLIADNLVGALPGHGDRRPRALPRHPRRGLRDLRRGRRPARGRRGRAAPPPVRRGRAGRGPGRASAPRSASSSSRRCASRSGRSTTSPGCST